MNLFLSFLSSYSVGSLRESIPLSSIVIPDDYAYLGAPPHILHDYSSHFVPCMCIYVVFIIALDMEMRERVVQILKEDGFSPISGGTYFQTVGPRFETKAEIRLYQAFFEYVGMTGASEATLTQELGMSLCMIGLVDNMAHGLGEPLTVEVGFPGRFYP